MLPTSGGKTGGMAPYVCHLEKQKMPGTIPLTLEAVALIEMRRNVGGSEWVLPAPTQSEHGGKRAESLNAPGTGLL